VCLYEGCSLGTIVTLVSGLRPANTNQHTKLKHLTIERPELQFPQSVLLIRGHKHKQTKIHKHADIKKTKTMTSYHTINIPRNHYVPKYCLSNIQTEITQYYDTNDNYNTTNNLQTYTTKQTKHNTTQHKLAPTDTCCSWICISDIDMPCMSVILPVCQIGSASQQNKQTHPPTQLHLAATKSLETRDRSPPLLAWLEL